MVREYNRAAEWLGMEPLDLSAGDRMLLERYISWRKEAGMGPEQDVLRSLRRADSAEPAGASLAWDVLAHDLRSGHNVGSVIRTADALGLRTIRLSGYTPGPEVASVRGAAMGAEQWMKLVRESDPLTALGVAREEGKTIVALEVVPGAITLGQYDWPEEGLLILGNEELGIPPDVLARAHAVVRIPMYGRKASLNVANAFALAAWEIRRAFEKKTT